MKKILIFSLLALVIFMCACKESDQDKLKRLIGTIEIPENVTSDLELKEEYELDGMIAKATWQSLSSKSISNDGKIKVSIADQTASLFLTLDYNGITETRTYNFKIPGNRDLLMIEVAINDRVQFKTYEIKSDLNLPQTVDVDGNTVYIKWESSNESIIANDGKVTRPDKDEIVTIKGIYSLNYAKKEKTYNFTVLQSEESLPSNTYHLANVYQGTITGEVGKPKIPNIFAGAIYHKVVSSRDYWLGIEATLTVPEFTVDSERYDRVKDKYLDNGSMYMGGNAAFESDIGLTWCIGYIDSSRSKISNYGFCFRPFHRYITKKEPGKEGILSNIYKNADANLLEYYYFPGDKIRMSVYSPQNGYLQLRVELLELTTIEKYVKIREGFDLGNNFNRVYLTEYFPSESMGVAKTEFKRVNAIDQVSNEGKQTLNTNAKYENAIWHEVYLYRNIDGVIYKVPMDESRSSFVNAPNGKNINGDFSNAFYLSSTEELKVKGGEIVSIKPNNGTGRLYNVAYIPNNNVYKPKIKKES